MELRHRRYFVAVGEALNFTKAATRMRVAQPALSRQVSDLEDELGVDLLKRTSHGVVLTAEGKQFLEDAWGILQRVEPARGMPAGPGAPAAGGFSCCCRSPTPPGCNQVRATAQFPLSSVAGCQLRSGWIIFFQIANRPRALQQRADRRRMQPTRKKSVSAS